MSKGLEALNVLWESKQECSTSCNGMCLECQKAKAREIIEKELKALEIIKNKKVQVAYLHSMWDDFETTFNNNDENVRWLYNEGREIDEQLTQEEYDLLKELNYEK